MNFSGYTITGGDAGLYALFTGTGTTTAAITAAMLLVTADSATKTYGDLLALAGSAFTASGLRNGETIGTITQTSAGTAATASVAGAPYAIVASGATGGTFDAGNYLTSYANGALAVTPVVLPPTITPPLEPPVVAPPIVPPVIPPVVTAPVEPPIITPPVEPPVVAPPVVILPAAPPVVPPVEPPRVVGPPVVVPPVRAPEVPPFVAQIPTHPVTAASPVGSSELASWAEGWWSQIRLRDVRTTQPFVVVDRGIALPARQLMTLSPPPQQVLPHESAEPRAVAKPIAYPPKQSRN